MAKSCFKIMFSRAAEHPDAKTALQIWFDAVSAAEGQSLGEMPLSELRAARNLTQEHLAEFLHVKQASISKMERRTDMYIGTLSKFIQAMGGEMEICAVFPAGAVRITQFSQER